MKIGCIIQARLGSTRLPCKVMLSIGDQPLLSILLNQVSRCTLIDEVVIATTTLRQDSIIVDFCKRCNTNYFCGSSEDVLSRYLHTAKKFDFDIIVRITADCPFVDPEIIDTAIKHFLDAKGSYELVTNRYPLTFIDGMDVDVMSINSLENACATAIKPHQREHVVKYFWEANRPYFNFVDPDNYFSKYRLTIDYPEDYLALNQVYNCVSDNLTYANIVQLLNIRPDIVSVNSKYIPGFNG